jgi:hypothetical protein
MVEIPPLPSDVRWLALFLVQDIQARLNKLEEMLIHDEDEDED